MQEAANSEQRLDAAPAQDRAPLRLPAILVRTESAAIAAFRAEACVKPGQGVPLTFPFCWLALPLVRSAIVEMVGAGFLPLHESQNFQYGRALEIDSDYQLVVDLNRTESPPRLKVRAEVSTLAGEPCVRFETVLRIADIAQAAA